MDRKNIIQKLIHSIRTLSFVYEELIKIFAQEKTFVLEHSLYEIEEVLKEKSKYADQISVLYEQIQSLLEGLFSSYGKKSHVPDEENNLTIWQQKILQLIKKDESNKDLIQLLDAKKDLLQVSKKFLPLFRENQIIIKTLLESHQNSLYFFHSLAEETNMSYDQHGKKKTNSNARNIHTEV